MGTNNRRSMGAFCYKRGLQTGILRDSKEHRNKIHLCICKRSRYFRYRSKRASTKRSCRICTSERNRKRFLQHIFSCPQENRGHETSNKFKNPLNKYLRKQHFKMDSLSTVLNLVKQGDWGISLDLKDAYLHVPIYKTHKKYLRFCLKNGRALQFKALPFGPTSAPRVFTKIVAAVVAAHLRSRGIRLVVYLDDWFLLNQEKSQLILDRELVLNLLVELGFIINLKKSTLDPSQQITYLGAMFLLDLGIVLPTVERTSKLITSSQAMILQNQVVARDFLHLLGIMSSCLEIIPNARLHMRPVQIHLLKFWKPVSQNLEFKVPITAHLRKPSKMVVRSNQHKKGEIIETLGNPCHYDNGCLNISGLGRSHGDSDSTRNLEPIGEKTPYQLLRNGSSDKNDKTLLIPIEGEKCINTLRQLNGGTIHQSSRGYQINDSLSKNLGIMEFGNRSSDSIESSPHCGQSKHF
ncbi:Hypothetical predicted protein [Mytilus galloprovincialis]|uniref:Reverse transcriptase domain-containing protein n=1 Tax=Mytilus galloprovincialis TaxID=29158 RepID=A0A8B6DC45_MYTGA|nr:Hypothetical predicted protein [Mytilus galloprovincialis]